jgi:uncharacterized DUF497 family protein
MTFLYEWDARKAAANLRKHGVSFEAAATVLDDTLSRTAVDRGHSLTEARYITLGSSGQGRVLVVGHTDRNGAIRIICARLASRLERRQYEAGWPQ